MNMMNSRERRNSRYFFFFFFATGYAFTGKSGYREIADIGNLSIMFVSFLDEHDELA